jgi:dihydroorotase
MSEKHRPTFIFNAQLVDPHKDTSTRGGIIIKNGKIADLGSHLVSENTGPEDAISVNAHGHVVAPGLVDMRAFVGEPGAEHRETLASASQAAAAGGVTTIICMPDTSPTIDEPAIVDFVKRRARDTAIVNIHPMAALTKGLAGKEMTEFGLLQEAGAVAFTDGAKTLTNASVMRRALTYARHFDALIVHHAEDPDLKGTGVMNEGALANLLGLSGIPREAEVTVLERDMRLVALTNGRYHAAALSCAESLPILRKAKDIGLKVSASVTINHLSFNENDIGPYRTFFKLSPPLRTENDRQALIEAVSEGLIDVIVSDHNPQDVDTKRLPFAESEDGAIGLETMLSAGLRIVHAQQITLPRLLHAMSTRPAELLGLAGGKLQKGEKADIILFDPEYPWILSPAKLKSRSKNTAFDESRMTGKVLKTFVGGIEVYEASDD